MLRKSINGLREKFFFTVEDVAHASHITIPSARVLCCRYVKNGNFVRLKKNFYCLAERWHHFSLSDFFQLANFLQVPSYISFKSALIHYGLIETRENHFFECASLKRSVSFKVNGSTFQYYKLNERCYFDFIKEGSVFIATKEKAFVDAVYLYSFGKYTIDFDEIAMHKLNTGKLYTILREFPEKTQNIVKKVCGIL